MAEVKVYTTSTCPWCTKVKEYLADKGVAYQELDVGNDRQAAREMIELTGQRGVPVTVIGDKIVVGFDEAELERGLGRG